MAIEYRRVFCSLLLSWWPSRLLLLCRRRPPTSSSGSPPCRRARARMLVVSATLHSCAPPIAPQPLASLGVAPAAAALLRRPAACLLAPRSILLSPGDVAEQRHDDCRPDGGNEDHHAGDERELADPRRLLVHHLVAELRRRTVPGGGTLQLAMTDDSGDRGGAGAVEQRRSPARAFLFVLSTFRCAVEEMSCTVLLARWFTSREVFSTFDLTSRACGDGNDSNRRRRRRWGKGGAAATTSRAGACTPGGGGARLVLDEALGVARVHGAIPPLLHPVRSLLRLLLDGIPG